jgi:hypothetical protein
MIDIDSISSQVKHNCNISDARYWGYYSPCGLLLRLRDLYKFEHVLKPWESMKNEEIGAWIDIREKLWQELDDHDFNRIEIQDREYDPFDAKGINSAVEEYGYVYSAGYGNLLKPVFTFAKLAKKSIKGKFSVYIMGREIARDLSTSPAMIQGNTILLRHETMNMFFWSKFEEMKAIKCEGALFHAFSEYGMPKDRDHTMTGDKREQIIELITQEEISTYIHHEIGEASQRSILGRWWKEMLFNLPYSRAELFLRGLKDVMSDTCKSGTLSYIIKNQKAGSLGFYIALLGGFRKSLFPDILPAYSEFTETGNWNLIEDARIEGYKKAGDYVRRLKVISDKHRVSAENIEAEVMPKIV